MALDFRAIRDQLVSHAMSLGVFNQVLDHEPVSAPGSGLTYAVFGGGIAPSPQNSGLSSTSARLVFSGRIYLPADTEPMGDVDVEVMNAVDLLFGAYSGDFDLGGSVRNLDLLGADGQALTADLRYLQLDSTTYRTANLNLPMIVNDVWTQVA
ncbi:MAG: hypothetical protein HOV82_17045 [Streptomyces sp.]|nr:hypothetical protein [Streptomyces sp.]NUP36202.1 hypothetical protein [Streptomyces sp.]NUS75549.1 hypothetical protein [Streptomyces sp.]